MGHPTAIFDADCNIGEGLQAHLSVCSDAAWGDGVKNADIAPALSLLRPGRSGPPWPMHWPESSGSTSADAADGRRYQCQDWWHILCSRIGSPICNSAAPCERRRSWV